MTVMGVASGYKKRVVNIWSAWGVAPEKEGEREARGVGEAKTAV